MAGTGTKGYSGDGGPATSAWLYLPQGVAVDGAGNLYIADSGNSRIRLVTPDGKITTFAGTGTRGSSGDGGPATSAQLSYPVGIAWDGAKGALYIGDVGNASLRYVLSGTIHKVTSAPSAYIHGIAVDRAGNVLFTGIYTDSHRVYGLTPSGVTTIAGTGPAGFSGDWSSPLFAQLWTPWGIAVDADDYTYIADSSNHRIRLLHPSPRVIITTAGDGTDSYSGDNGPVASAQIGLVYDVALDRDGNLYISEGNGHRVRRVSPDGTIKTVAGNGTDGYSGDGGPATSAQLRTPSGIVVDGAGYLYIADRQAHCVRRVSPVDGGITTVAGTGAYGYSGDGGPATSARLWVPRDLALDSAGNLYIADSENLRIRRVSLSTSPAVITTVAGNGIQGHSGDGGPAISAALDNPAGVAVDELGRLYIAENQAVRRVSGDTITTVAGTGACCFSGDGGQATLARVNLPQAIAFDRGGNLFIADTYNQRIRRVSSGIITTVAGTGVDGYSGDGGPATSAQLHLPIALAVDGAGSIYVGLSTYAVRKLTAVACQVSATPAALTAAATGGPHTLTIQAAAGCAWSITGLPAWITASAASGSGPGTVTLTVAANAGAPRSATITAAGTSVTINQASGGGACVVTLGHAGQVVGDTGGTGTFAVSASCGWNAVSQAPWITITSGATGSGQGTISYQVLPNTTGRPRSGTITVDYATFTIEQLANGAALPSAGTMAQVASGGSWKTTFTLVNNGATRAVARLVLSGDDGAALTLPLTFPQTGVGPILGSTVEREIEAGATVIIESEATDAKQGWAELLTDGTVSGFAVFRQRLGEGEQEAVVPLEARTAAGYVLAFDNMNGFVTGVAVANVGSQGGVITVIINGDDGQHIHTGELRLDPRNHTADELFQWFPATENKRGTIEFQPPAGGRISVLGLRFNPKHSFTSVPVMPK